MLPFPKQFLWNLSSDGDLTVDYFADTIFQQEFTIKYKLCDTLNNCDTATILVNIIENKPPTTNTVYFTIPNNSSSSYEFDVFENVSDVDGVDSSSLTIITPSLVGSSLITAQHIIKYNLGMNQEMFDSDTINYQICDYSCMCKSDKVIIHLET